MSAFVIDTNVLIVANMASPQASDECWEACSIVLGNIRENPDDIVCIDDSGEILNQYRRYASHAGEPGLGDYFFKWLFDNQSNPERCERVKITEHDERVYEEFPPDPNLTTFDKADRIFASVALQSRYSPAILNATDTDWWHTVLNLPRTAFI